MRRRQWFVRLACAGIIVSCGGCPGVDRKSVEMAALDAILGEPGQPAQLAAAPAPAAEAVSPPQLSAAVVTLRQCLEWALQNNLELSVQRLNPDIRDAQIVEALAAFDALFTGTYAYEKDEAPSASALTGATSLMDEVSASEYALEKRLLTGAQTRLGLDWAHSSTNSLFATLNPRSEANLVAAITQPLLRDFGIGVNTAAIRIARNGKAGSIHLFRKSVEDALSAVEETYWTLYRSIQELEVRRRQLQRAQDLLDRARKFVAAGKAAPVEQVSAEAEVARVKSEIIIAENDVRLAEDVMKRLINRPDLPLGSRTRLIPADAPGDVAKDVDVAQTIAEALAHRPDLKAAELDQTNAGIRRDVARQQLLPRLDLTYEYRLHGLDRRVEKSIEELSQFEFDQHRVLLNLRIPIGNRRAQSQHEQARLRSDQSRRNVAVLRQQIALEITRVVDELRKYRGLITSEREATRSAKKRLEDEEARYKYQRSTRTDLLQAQTFLAEQELKEIRALVGLNINLSRFQRLKGTYLEHNNIVIETVPGN